MALICPQRELQRKNEEYWSVGVLEKTVLEIGNFVQCAILDNRV
jgi:hypothetical protein